MAPRRRKIGDVFMRSDLIKEGPTRAAHRSLLRALGIDELEHRRR